jgi:transcriptional regulator with XRE-family HTH domain
LPRDASGQPDPVDIVVGTRIRLRRKELGVSQEALADKIGVTFQQVQKYERGANRVSASMLSKIAQALDCGVADFFGTGEEPKNIKLFGMLATPGAVELLQAFAKIEAVEARRALIALARVMGGERNHTEEAA